MHNILVLGGYGFFGKRISAALAGDATIRVFIAGRDIKQAAAAAAELKLPIDQAVGVDAYAPGFVEKLIELRIDTLIHTAGPFQNQDYAIPRAAIKAGCNYVDLADARDFVAGINMLDPAARERGVTVISGASSVPALSTAVIDRYLPLFRRLHSVHSGIASGARTPGLATMRAVFGYCGKAFPRWENGAWVSTYGWMDLKRHRFPAPVGSRFLSSCDVPDLALLPSHYPSLQTVTFHAGFASGIGHLLVWSLSGLVKAGVIKRLTPLARPLNKISQWIEPIVSDKGAMFVTLSGVGLDGQPLQKTWNVIATQNRGPRIPCGAAIALARKFARGDALPKGAMPCIGLVTVDEYLAPLADLDILEIVE